MAGPSLRIHNEHRAMANNGTWRHCLIGQGRCYLISLCCLRRGEVSPHAGMRVRWVTLERCGGEGTRRFMRDDWKRVMQASIICSEADVRYGDVTIRSGWILYRHPCKILYFLESLWSFNCWAITIITIIIINNNIIKKFYFPKNTGKLLPLDYTHSELGHNGRE